MSGQFLRDLIGYVGCPAGHDPALVRIQRGDVGRHRRVYRAEHDDDIHLTLLLSQCGDRLSRNGAAVDPASMRDDPADQPVWSGFRRSMTHRLVEEGSSLRLASDGVGGVKQTRPDR